MRAVLQRVSKAKVVVDGRVVGAIRQGFVVLLGVTHEDNSSEAQWLADKIAGLRLFEDENGKLNLALAEVEGAVLLVQVSLGQR
jgi:D-tyrosyl-tRNA(Tyr) deacylase